MHKPNHSNNPNLTLKIKSEPLNKPEGEDSPHLHCLKVRVVLTKIDVMYNFIHNTNTTTHTRAHTPADKLIITSIYTRKNELADKHKGPSDVHSQSTQSVSCVHCVMGLFLRRPLRCRLTVSLQARAAAV